jgi:hypothetical protein
MPFGATAGRLCIRDWDGLRDREITFVTVAGSVETMIETYERMATCGTPHSVEDLEIMREWRRTQP